jgi:molybdenum cofactor cytidylyltransferase
VVEQVVSALLAAPVDEVLVVTGHRRAAVEEALAGRPARAVFNPDYAEGEMLSSVRCGLWAVHPGAQAALLVPGDMPGLETEVVARLVGAYRAGGDEAVIIPSYRMRAGHPVLVPRPFWLAILALPAGANLRSMLRAESTPIRWVVVDTPSVVRDMDTPDDYRRELELWEGGSGMRDT